ncbi:leucyl aminopeptidase family protein [Parasphingopyxis algicola]|uniref:leucyl aminopeptidase family protein n=1 Tax=Parasphingopyxis algicola TaxID=2026624 RepID=UPI0015A0C3DF|nr:leucyl aminopeptidase family protein [Parasphingopyxis algicola]QLC23817.1 leucyl aminopeptidase family protein [Parasphingopyxis algicola]
MTEYAPMLQPDKGQAAQTLHLVNTDGFDDWFKALPDRERQSVKAQGFAGKEGELAIVTGETPDDWSTAIGVSDPDKLTSWCLAKAAETLPAGTYRLAEGDPGQAAFGWLCAQYRFDRYKQESDANGPKILLTSKPATIEELIALADATDLVRTLVNIPAGDMGPAELQEAAEEIATRHGAELSVVSGTELTEGYPMIDAVGRAASTDRAPRLIELHWGDTENPRIAIVGKGVCFDSGGLDIKGAAGMRWMKKDMGGAAHALALAGLVMGRKLPVRLHLLIPAVENAIAGNAFRPGDILSSRKGLSVEIGNTDAEGRLILGDALNKACEDDPELLIDFATLTGAARTALGPDLPALFTDDEALASEIADAGMEIDDPVWRLPLWDGYDEWLKSPVADLSNTSSVAMAGASTAALFLRKFVENGTAWTHLDTFAWRNTAKPGRPKGGEALGVRAHWEMLKNRYSKT